MMDNRYFTTDMRRMGRGGRDRAMHDREKFTRYKGYIEREEDYKSGQTVPHTVYASHSIPRQDYSNAYMPMYSDMRSGDYAYDHKMDYRYDYGYDGHGEMTEEQYYKDLERWAEKLKKKDRFKMRKEDVLAQAKQMGVKFEEFSEMEFYVVYLMMISDYKNVANDHRMYLSMAKDWLEDDDIEVSPSEKLCIYYYDIVKGKGVE